MSNGFSAALTPGVSAQVLAVSFHELSALVGAGVTLDLALDQVSHTGPPHFRRALQRLSTLVGSGQPLSQGMRAYGGLFNPVVPAIISAGERTGNLDYSFSLLAYFFEKEAELKRIVQSAMVYPVIVVVVAIIAVGILSYIGFMPGTWAVRLLWMLGFCAAAWLLLRFRAIQQIARYLIMLLPFFGGIIQQLAVARFCQTFGLLTRAGVPYLEGLEATGPAIQHPIVKQAADFVYAGVRNGNSIEQSIRAQPAFPAIVRNLVGAGETAGTVDEALLKAAEYLRNDAEYKIRNSAKFAGPVFVIVVGIIVALVLISFWSSYFSQIFSILED